MGVSNIEVVNIIHIVPKFCSSEFGEVLNGVYNPPKVNGGYICFCVEGMVVSPVICITFVEGSE
jgi:hypothetical protein